METEIRYGLAIFDCNKLQMNKNEDHILKYPENITVNK